MAEGGGGGLYRGASQDQDVRYSDKEKKLLKSTKFPIEYSTKVDIKKIKLDVIKPWIAEKVTELLGFEDEVLIGYIIGLIEEKQFPDPRVLQLNITGFLSRDASQLVLSLWKLLISAQDSIGGIPPQLLNKKKEEIKERMAERERIKAELSKKTIDSEREEQSNRSSKPNERDNKGGGRNRSRSRSRERRRSNSRERDRYVRRRSRSRSRDRRRDRPYRDRSRDRSPRERRRDRDRSRSRERRRSNSRERQYNNKKRYSPDDRRTSSSSKQTRRSRSPINNDKRPSSSERERSNNNDDLDTKKEEELRQKALETLKRREN